MVNLFSLESITQEAPPLRWRVSSQIVLDTLMALVFVLLLNKNAVAGLTFHEIAGLTIGLAFIIHIIINFKWVKQITSKFFKSKINLKTRIGYIIDLLLLIDMAV